MLLFVNELTVIDFSYLCEQRGIVGESWIVDVVLGGDLNDESMVLDFGLVKKQLKQFIDLYIDHKLLVPLESSITTIQHTNGNVLVDFERCDNRSIHLNCPNEAYVFLDTASINIESVENHLRKLIKNELPTNIQELKISLRTEQIDTPYYHYSHGLKKHDGNCQRIVHGHRSKIIIEQDGKRNEPLEAQWCQRWQDIYLGTQEDIVDSKSLNISTRAQELIDNEACNDHLGFAYDANQGRFEMLMPRSECAVIETDSTVECLAQLIANQLNQETPDSIFKVYAFEGVGKGAIAVSH